MGGNWLNNWLMSIWNNKQLYLTQLAHLEMVMANLLVSLEALTNPQMIMAIQQRFEAAPKRVYPSKISLGR